MSKFGWSYPPGVSEGMLPGNTPQDAADEALADLLYIALESLHDHMPNTEAAERAQDDVVLRLMKIVSATYDNGYKDGMADERMAHEGGPIGGERDTDMSHLPGFKDE